MIQEDNSSRRSALIVAVVFHGAIIAALIFLTLKPPYPLPKEVSVEVAMSDLGSTIDGSGDFTPDRIALPTASEIKPNIVNTPQPNQTSETPTKVLTDESSETGVNTPEKPVEKKTINETAQPNNEPATKVETNRKPAILYKKSTGTAGGSESGGSEGSGEGIGDRGSADGTPGGKGILGNGSGGWELNGRSMVKEYRIPTTKEQGTVVVKIWVDKRGTVFRSKALLEGSSTTSEYLFKLAEDAALQYKYNSKDGAPPEQVGKMTFIFILK